MTIYKQLVFELSLFFGARDPRPLRVGPARTFPIAFRRRPCFFLQAGFFVAACSRAGCSSFRRRTFFFAAALIFLTFAFFLPFVPCVFFPAAKAIFANLAATPAQPLPASFFAANCRGLRPVTSRACFKINFKEKLDVLTHPACKMFSD